MEKTLSETGFWIPICGLCFVVGAFVGVFVMTWHWLRTIKEDYDHEIRAIDRHQRRRKAMGCRREEGNEL